MSRIYDKIVFFFFQLLRVPLIYFFCKRTSKILKEWNDVSIWQLKLLMDIICESNKSSFGKKYHLSDIKSVEQFRKNIQIGSSELVSSKDFVSDTGSFFFNSKKVVKEFIVNGTKNLSVVPITYEYVKKVKNFWMLWSTFLFKDHSELLGTKGVFVSNKSKYRPKQELQSDVLDSNRIGSVYQDVSCLMIDNTLGFIKRRLMVPEFVSSISNDTLRYYLVCRFSLGTKEPRFLITGSKDTLKDISQVLDRYAAEITQDMFQGGINLGIFKDKDVLISDSDRNKIVKNKHYFKKDLKAFYKLDTLLKSTGKLTMSDIWPKLSMIASFQTLNEDLDEIKTLYGCKNIRYLQLISSQGSFCVSMKDEAESGLLNLDFCFYEFILEKDYKLFKQDGIPPKTYLAHEIQSSTRYYMIVTTPSGLYRYDTECLIECSGHYKNIPIIKPVRVE